MNIRILLGIVFLLSFANTAEAKRYKFAYIEYPPFIVSKDKKMSGFLVDKIKKMFPDQHVEWISVPLDRIPQAINKGMVDASVVYVKTPERAKLLDFSDKPITTVTPHVCYVKKFKFTKDTLQEVLNDKTITVVPRGNAYATHQFKQMGAKTKLLQISYEGDYIHRSLKLVANARADFAFIPALPYDHSILKNNNVSCYPVGREIGIPFAVKKGNKRLLEELNKAITDLDVPLRR